MPIRQLTPKADIDRFIANRVDAMKSELLRRLHYVGERVLNQARANSIKSYKDQTGNLRSSVGYVIAVDGRVVETSSFEVVKKGHKGSQGGKDFALQKVSEFPRGIVLIVVAGMNYAQHVTDRGRDVLDSSELLANRLVPEMLRKLGLK